MWQPIRHFILLTIGLAALAFGALSSQIALAKTDSQAELVWEIRLPTKLQGRLYEFVVVSSESRVIATTPREILSIENGGVIKPLVKLRSSANIGESAILASDGRHAGILVHRGHAISGFRLLDLNGETLASIETPHQFHYRIAPDHQTFIGMDAGGHHAQSKAKHFIYRLYGQSGNLIKAIESSGPQAFDSAYTPDGAAFILSNAAGLNAHQAKDGEQLWQTSMPSRLFAAASAEAKIVIAASAGKRNLLQAYQDGESLWRFNLDRNIRNLAISPNGQFMLASDGHTIHALSPRSGTPLWSRKMPDRMLAINSLAVTDQGVVALGAQHSDLTKGIALVVDKDNNTLLEREFTHNLSNAWIPTVQFDASGKSLLIRTLEELILIKID